MPFHLSREGRIPPTEWDDVFDAYAEWAAWYSGDPNKIARVHQRLAFNPTPRGRHWAAQIGDERRIMLHVPIAGDIAQTSADLLFSEAPNIRIPEDQEAASESDIEMAQDRLTTIVEEGGVHNRLLEAAESCAALGGVFIGPVWDRDVSSHPMLRVAQVDMAFPRFRWGVLWSVTLWREVFRSEDDAVIWRHFEHHERGVIENSLWEGTIDHIGKPIALTEHPSTAGLQEVFILPEPMRNDLAIRYVPNMRPNRRFRGDPVGGPLGISDYAGIEGLMDALDEVYTCWQRDVRIGKARITVPEEWITRIQEDGSEESTLRFDEDREVYVGMHGEGASSSAVGINAFQPDVRHESFMRTALEYIDRIVSAAGYSPQSFGLQIEGRAESGTALRIRERKSLMTRQKKERYFKPAIEDTLWQMLVIDREVLGNPTPVFRPQVDLQDSVVPDLRDTATSLELLKRSQSMSVEERIRLLQPDWTDEQVVTEAERIRAEEGSSVPDPLQVGIA